VGGLELQFIGGGRAIPVLQQSTGSTSRHNNLCHTTGLPEISHAHTVLGVEEKPQ